MNKILIVDITNRCFDCLQRDHNLSLKGSFWGIHITWYLDLVPEQKRGMYAALIT